MYQTTQKKKRQAKFAKDINVDMTIIVNVESDYVIDLQTTIKLLIENNNADVNAIDNGGNTALICGASLGNVEIVKSIVNIAKTNNIELLIDCQNGLGNSAVWYAAVNGHIQILDILLKCGPNFDQRNKQGNTPLIGAAWFNEFGSIDFMISQHPSICHVNKRNSQTDITALIAAIETRVESTSKDKKSKQNKNGEVFAIDSLKVLLQSDSIDVNIGDFDGNTPLICAAVQNNIEAVELLLSDSQSRLTKLNIESKNKYGNTAVLELSICQRKGRNTKNFT